MLTLDSWVFPCTGPSVASPGDPAWYRRSPSNRKNKIKNKTTTTTGLKITQPSQTPASMELGSSVKRCCGTGAFCGPWMQQLEPRCAGRSGAGKRNGGMGRNEMLFLRLQSLAVLGRVMVRAVLGVDFIQAGLHTSR